MPSVVRMGKSCRGAAPSAYVWNSIIPAAMIPLVRVLVPLLTAAVLIGACAGNDDDAAPVATMTVTVDQPRPPAGSVVDFTYRFVVAAEAPPFTDDYVVFVHFVDADGEQLWTDDHEPPTPVRSWQPGSVIEYER